MILQQQRSFEATNMLYIVPTPIGNLEDITLRALRILKEVDVIAAEDTRQTRKLLTHFDIKTALTSYHEHNKESGTKKLVNLLKEGKNIAIVSDAGTPTISDPGYELVVEAIANGCTVVPLPGANAALTALTASGLPTIPFYFYGFLDRQKKTKRSQLEQLKYNEATIIFYESPHRLKETLQIMKEVFDNRRIVLCRELTKRFEHFLRGTVEEALEWAETEEVRGEFCLLLEGTKEKLVEDKWWEPLTIEQHVNVYAEQQMNVKEAMKQVAKERGLSKREIYQAYHGL